MKHKELKCKGERTDSQIGISSNIIVAKAVPHFKTKDSTSCLSLKIELVLCTNSFEDPDSLIPKLVDFGNNCA